MAAKKKQSKARISSTKTNNFKFKWWMALVLVVIVGGVGLTILRFSQARSFLVTSYKSWLVEDCSPNDSESNLYRLTIGFRDGNDDSCSFSLGGFLHNYFTIRGTGSAAKGIGKLAILNCQFYDGGRCTTYTHNINHFGTGGYGYTELLAEYVKSFQRREGLTPDGIVGPRTWARIMDYCSGRTSAGDYICRNN